MRLKEFLSESTDQFFKTKEEITQWLTDLYIWNYTINDDLTVDVHGSVDLTESDIKHFPVRFGNVTGSFYVNNCASLLSLEGSPHRVGAGFGCSGCNELESLHGAPEIVGGAFNCSHCESLITLEGAPKEVYGHFICDDCTGLLSLKGAPEKTGRSFTCENCTDLRSLEHCPTDVGGLFSIDGCSSIESLDHAPKRVARVFYCQQTKAKNLLRVLKIKDLKSVSTGNDQLDAIIDKYLPEGDIFDCQQELMDAGLEEFAEL